MSTSATNKAFKKGDKVKISHRQGGVHSTAFIGPARIQRMGKDSKGRYALVYSISEREMFCDDSRKVYLDTDRIEHWDDEKWATSAMGIAERAVLDHAATYTYDSEAEWADKLHELHGVVNDAYQAHLKGKRTH